MANQKWAEVQFCLLHEERRGFMPVVLLLFPGAVKAQAALFIAEPPGPERLVADTPVFGPNASFRAAYASDRVSYGSAWVSYVSSRVAYGSS